MSLNCSKHVKPLHNCLILSYIEKNKNIYNYQVKDSSHKIYRIYSRVNKKNLRNFLPYLILPPSNFYTYWVSILFFAVNFETFCKPSGINRTNPRNVTRYIPFALISPIPPKRSKKTKKCFYLCVCFQWRQAQNSQSLGI